MIRHWPGVFKGSNARSLTAFAARDDTNFRQQISHRSFQPAETEILRTEHASRQIKAVWITAPRELLYFGAAGIPEPKHLRYLIECLAGGVVNGPPDHLVIAKGVQSNQHGVSTADNQ